MVSKMSEKEPKTLLEFAAEKPNLKFFFTGGKGGVGKTIVAAGIAHYYASKGEKILLASLNPVHSLSSMFGQELWGGGIKKVEGVENLYAIEVDIKETVQQYKDQLAERLRWFLKWADIPVKADDFTAIASTNPAFEESAMFDVMLDLMLKEIENYDKIVFDCAAVANAVRLLGLGKIYDLWLSRMIASREEAMSLRVKLSFRKEKVKDEIKKDPMMADLLEMRTKMHEAKKYLNNPEATAFFFVTIPLALPIAVVKRFIAMVRGFDIPIGGVFVNMVIPEDVVKGKVTEYMENKYKEQQNYLGTIKKDLWPLVRGEVPLFQTEIVGIDMIAKVADAVANWKPHS